MPTKIKKGSKKAPARKPAKPSPGRAAKAEEAPRAADPRIPAIGQIIDKRRADGELVASVKRTGEHLFVGIAPKAIEGKEFKSLSAVARAVTGKGWFGLVWFGLVPYNKPGRRGVTDEQLASAYLEIEDVINRARRAADAPLPRLLPPSLGDAMVDNMLPSERAAMLADMRATAKQIKEWAITLDSCANMIEVRKGRAQQEVA